MTRSKVRGGKPRADWKPYPRANKPAVYVCPCCGEKLSGPARFYTCPRTDARGIRLPEAA